MSRELILPSLNMTKSSSFLPNSQTPQYSVDGTKNVPKLSNKALIDSENPYNQQVFSNMAQTPN